MAREKKVGYSTEDKQWTSWLAKGQTCNQSTVRTRGGFVVTANAILVEIHPGESVAAKLMVIKVRYQVRRPQQQL